MTAATIADERTEIERDIAARLSDAKIRLRLDKSVLRLIEDLKTALPQHLPAGHAVIVTITAPIRRRARTCAQVEAWVESGVPDADAYRVIEDNQLRLRRVPNVRPHMPRVVVLVHNPDADTGVMLSIAEAGLLERL